MHQHFHNHAASTWHTLWVALAAVIILPLVLLSADARPATAAPFGNTVVQWNKIAEDTVVGSGAFQNEGLIYMAYVSAAVYDAAVAITGGYEPYNKPIAAPAGASVDAAVVEAAYRTLVQYFPAQTATLDAYRSQSLSVIADGPGKDAGIAVGATAALAVIGTREGDGRSTIIGSTSTFPTLAAGPGVWRLTPGAFALPQTPWVGNVRPFVLDSADRFMPKPPPALASKEWANAFDETKRYGAATDSVRTDAQTATAKFWSANVIRQYNALVRDLAFARGVDLTDTARLAAMMNVVGADAQISVMRAKYRYLFWRPVTAIDTAAVTADGFGLVTGYDDGNPNTVEQSLWRPLLATPNHPEYPAAHGSITSAAAEVVKQFLGTTRFDVDIRGFDAAGSAGNINATRHFTRADDLRDEIVDARVWAGVHYRFSGVAGVTLGRNVAKYDLARAFRPVG